MKPSQLQRLLSNAFRNKLKILIKGMPGIGKTEIVLAAAAAANCATVIMHPAVSDPTDFKGLPALTKGGLAEFLPYGQLRKLIDASGPTVCFIDDIGQAPHAVQAALMQLIQQREIDGHRISDHVVFCGATNDNSHMAGVQSILEPVKSRWHTIVELKADIHEWVRWAKSANLAEEVIAFVLFKGQEALCDFKATRDLSNSPVPRTVANAAALYAAGIRNHTILAGAAGEGWATMFLAFVKVYKSLPDPDECIRNPRTAKVPPATDPSVLCAIAVAVSLRATPANFANVIIYLARLPKEYEVYGVQDALLRDGDLTDTSGFIAWANANSAVLG